MAITEAVAAQQSTSLTKNALRSEGTWSAENTAELARPTGPTEDVPVCRPVPVWFFAFEGLIGAAYDVVKTSPHAWIVLAVAVVTNIALARTLLRGRLKMAKAMLKGRRTRKLAVGLIGLRVGVHFALGAIGVEATSQGAHLAFAALMCATTVGLLAFDQRVMLRALGAA